VSGGVRRCQEEAEVFLRNYVRGYVSYKAVQIPPVPLDLVP